MNLRKMLYFQLSLYPVQNNFSINEKNYQSKFEEYLSDVDNKKWEEIANSGRKFVMDNLTNDHAVNNLVELMTELI